MITPREHVANLFLIILKRNTNTYSEQTNVARSIYGCSNGTACENSKSYEQMIDNKHLFDNNGFIEIAEEKVP